MAKFLRAVRVALNVRLGCFPEYRPWAQYIEF